MRILHPSNIAVITGDTHHAKWIEETGTLIHDGWFADQITRHIQPGDVVIEGGANIGTLTKAMLISGAKVIAFESNPEAVECLLHNCESESLTIYGGCALSESPDDLVTMHRQDNAGASYCTPGGEIPCYTIDELNVPKCALIKLDIEGYEAKVIRGASETIARCRPVIVAEVNRTALERVGDSEDVLWALLESNGYIVTVMQENCERGCPQYDVLAVPGI